MRVRLLITLTCLLPYLLTCLSSAVAAQAAPAGLEQYLRTVGLGAKDLASAARGRAVVKLLPTSSNRDVAVFGMIGVGASRDSVVAYALDPPRFLAARGRRFGVFANPPAMADVRDVAFDGSEYRDLRRCRPGDCVAKLPASEMNAFIERIDWSASDAKARVDERLRELLVRLVSEYAEGGNGAMVVYDDAAHAVRAGDAFAELLAQSTNLYASAPALERYLTTYPASRPPGARDYVYWAEDRLPRLRPTLTLGQVVVYAPPEAGSTAAFVARKQLYASHYFEGALELLAVVDAAGPGAQPASYLITMRRFRFDALPGGLLNIRGRVRSQMVDATRADLEHHRSALAATHAR